MDLLEETGGFVPFLARCRQKGLKYAAVYAGYPFSGKIPERKFEKLPGGTETVNPERFRVLCLD